MHKLGAEDDAPRMMVCSHRGYSGCTKENFGKQCAMLHDTPGSIELMAQDCKCVLKENLPAHGPSSRIDHFPSSADLVEDDPIVEKQRDCSSPLMVRSFAFLD